MLDRMPLLHGLTGVVPTYGITNKIERFIALITKQ